MGDGWWPVASYTRGCRAVDGPGGRSVIHRSAGSQQATKVDQEDSIAFAYDMRYGAETGFRDE